MIRNNKIINKCGEIRTKNIQMSSFSYENISIIKTLSKLDEPDMQNTAGEARTSS